VGELSYQVRAGLRHAFTATTRYSLHPPFLYQLYQAALLPARKQTDPDIVRAYKNALKNDTRLFQKTELGNKQKNYRHTTVKREASRISVPPKYGRLLANLIHHLGCHHILELGTGLGVSTAYLAYGLSRLPKARKSLATVEGCPGTLGIVQRHWANLMTAEPQPAFYQGELSTKLSLVLENSEPVDLAIIDANHRQAALKEYANAILTYLADRGVLVVDDIHWSSGMAQAWDELKMDDRIRMTVDLYRMGIAFTDQRLTPVHLRLRF
jgi:predicted O-methyltransferase YrrM